jgi:hypothetical protein
MQRWKLGHRASDMGFDMVGYKHLSETNKSEHLYIPMANNTKPRVAEVEAVYIRYLPLAKD